MEVFSRSFSPFPSSVPASPRADRLSYVRELTRGAAPDSTVTNLIDGFRTTELSYGESLLFCLSLFLMHGVGIHHAVSFHYFALNVYD